MDFYLFFLLTSSHATVTAPENLKMKNKELCEMYTPTGFRKTCKTWREVWIKDK